MLSIIVMFACVVFFGADAVFAQEIKSIPISVAFFEDVATRTRINIESIVTIQGDVEIQYERYKEKEAVTFQKSKTFFAVDKKNNNRLSLRSLDEFWRLENAVKEKKRCTIDGYLYVGDVAYWYTAANLNAGDPNINPQNHASVIGKIRIDQRDVRRHDHSPLPEYFDPFDNMAPSQVVPSQAILFAAKSFSHQPPLPRTYSATQAGNFLTIKIEREIPVKIGHEIGPKPAAHIYVFDTTKSYYLIEYKTMINNICFRYWKCEPVLVDGVWFPSTVSEFTVGGKNKNEYRFSNVKINQKIPDNIFTLQFMGVRQKDYIFDTRTQTESEVDDPSFPLPEYLKQIERKSKSKWIFIGVGLLLIFISVYRMFSRWRKKKTPENTNQNLE
jgi:hypothetical protein